LRVWCGDLANEFILVAMVLCQKCQHVPKGLSLIQIACTLFPLELMQGGAEALELELHRRVGTGRICISAEKGIAWAKHEMQLDRQQHLTSPQPARKGTPGYFVASASQGMYCSLTPARSVEQTVLHRVRKQARPPRCVLMHCTRARFVGVHLVVRAAGVSCILLLISMRLVAEGGLM
jgi:hypothetical protein